MFLAQLFPDIRGCVEPSCVFETQQRLCFFPFEEATPIYILYVICGSTHVHALQGLSSQSLVYVVSSKLINE
jgi:hypothetical protein